jgi:hypothetical protein
MPYRKTSVRAYLQAITNSRPTLSAKQYYHYLYVYHLQITIETYFFISLLESILEQ